MKKARKRGIVRDGHNLIRTLSKQGVVSRKQAVDLVLAGRVKVNGAAVCDPGRMIEPKDRILLDGKPLRKKEAITVLLHKPAGYVTTRRDERGRKTVYDLLGGIGRWIFPVGRLDKDSEGLLLLTNDTALGERLTNPKFRIRRTYEVEVKGNLREEDLDGIRRGIDIGRGETARPVSVRVLSGMSSSARLEVVLTEGKNREIRRMFEALGMPVVRLVRTRFGPFRLGTLAAGEWREVRNAAAKLGDPAIDGFVGNRNYGEDAP